MRINQAGFRNALSRSAVFVYCCVTGLIAAVVTFCYAGTSFWYKDAASPVLLARGIPCAAGAALLFLLFFYFRRFRFPAFSEKAFYAAGTAALLLWYTAAVRHASFMGGGDDPYYILNSAMAYGRGETMFIETEYLELYPNNIMLTAVYGLVLRVWMAVTRTEPGPERFRMLLCLMQGALCAACCLLAARAARRLTQSRRLAAYTWLSCAALAGLSPYFLVPYSDSTALILPILLFLIWLRIRSSGSLLLGCVYGLLAGLAWLIKPHAFLPVLAGLMTSFLYPEQPLRRRLPCLLAGAVCFFVMLVPVSRLLQRSMNLKIDPEARVGMAHFLDMGLNTRTDGCFADEDRAFARSFPTRAERDRACLARAAARVKEMGPAGLLSHARRKCLVNHADGTFAWNLDFSRRVVPPPKNAFSEIVRSAVYEEGELHRLLATLQQIVWQLLLLLLPFAALFLRRAPAERAPAVFMLMLSCVGILVFPMLFEAKARYVFTHVPLLCVLAVCGGSSIARRGGEKKP